jgi:hypothetical protein
VPSEEYYQSLLIRFLPHRTGNLEVGTGYCNAFLKGTSKGAQYTEKAAFNNLPPEHGSMQRVYAWQSQTVRAIPPKINGFFGSQRWLPTVVGNEDLDSPIGLVVRWVTWH